jgi:hypothetical protein
MKQGRIKEAKTTKTRTKASTIKMLRWPGRLKAVKGILEVRQFLETTRGNSGGTGEDDETGPEAMLLCFIACGRQSKTNEPYGCEDYGLDSK